jgi:hypothetical protein
MEANPFQLLCDQMIKQGRTHTEKDKLRSIYESAEEWPVKWAECNQVKIYYDKVLAEAVGS